MEMELLRTDDDISRFVNRYSDTVLRLAFSYLRNIQDAQDVCQNVFIKLFERNVTFADAEHEKAWVIRVTINACKDLMRSPWKRWFRSLDEAAIPIREKENREVVARVLELPAKYRSVIYLHYYENYGTREIAKLMNRNEATVRTQLKRARELLRTKMIGGVQNEQAIYTRHE